MTKILLTGFEPFDEVKVNPSQLIVEHFAKQKNADLITEVLPVAYGVAGERIKGLLQKHQPDVVIMLGVAQKQETIKLERIAVNINDATIPDNQGKHEAGKRIVDNAPVAYWSTLPLDDMFAAIAKAEIPVTFSNHAGAYLCNHVFYVARHTLEMTGHGTVPCGFIYLPSVETMPIETQIQAINLCLHVDFEPQSRQERKEKGLGELLINLKQAQELISDTEDDITKTFLEFARYKVVQEIMGLQSPFDMAFYISVMKRLFSNRVAIQFILDGKYEEIDKI